MQVVFLRALCFLHSVHFHSHFLSFSLLQPFQPSVFLSRLLFWIFQLLNQNLMAIKHESNVDIESLSSEAKKVDIIFSKIKYQKGGLGSISNSVKKVLLSDKLTSNGCRQEIKMVCARCIMRICLNEPWRNIIVVPHYSGCNYKCALCRVSLAAAGTTVKLCHLKAPPSK